VHSFHNFLPLLNMRCDLEPSRVALWSSKEHALRLSGLAACTLIEAGLVSWDDLRPHRQRKHLVQAPSVSSLMRLFYLQAYENMYLRPTIYTLWLEASMRYCAP
jgi:hypothetical protein